MPGSDDSTSPFDAMIERLFAVGHDFVGRATEAVIPRCNTCGERAVPIQCLICREYACAKHGHYSVGRGTCVCDCCVEFMAEEIEVEPAPGAEARAASGWRDTWQQTRPDDGFPWRVLGVKESATEAEIRQAYRRRAARVHPDVDPSPGAKKQFQELTRAHNVAVAIAQSRGA